MFFYDILLISNKGKKKPLIAAYFYCKLRTFDFSATQAPGAHVFGSGRTVFIDNFNFVDVRAPRPSGFAMAVAYHITAHLSFSTNAAYSRHIYHLRGCNRCIGRKKRSALNERYYYIKIDKKKQSILRAFA